LAKAGKKIPAAVAKRARQITVFLMDVDGTITDGGVTLLSLPDGTAQEIKTFNAHDGQGLTLAHTAGIRTGVITGRGSPALQRRAEELSIEFVYEHQPHKIAAYEEILKKPAPPRAWWPFWVTIYRTSPSCAASVWRWPSATPRRKSNASRITPPKPLAEEARPAKSWN